jgi:hypothetical protein
VSDPVTLATLTGEQLEPLVGQTFKVTLASGRTVDSTLRAVDVRATMAGRARAPFSFTLRVPGARAEAQQGTIRIEHPAIGTLDVFAVPVGQDGDAFLWQAVFS